MRRHRFRSAEMRQHSFQSQAGAGMKTPQHRSRFRGNISSHDAHTLPRHASVDLQVNREARGRKSPRRRRCLQQVKLPRLPNHRGKPLVNHRLCFPGKDSRHQQNARLRADGAHCRALLGSGHPQPLRSGAGQQWGAGQYVMAVGIGLDHRHHISFGARRKAQLLIVGQQPVAGDFRPKGSGKHGASIRPVLHQRPCSQSGCSLPGRRDAPSP